VVNAAMEGVSRAIAAHGTVPGLPPIYVGIVAERPVQVAGEAAARPAPRGPIFVGIVADGVQTKVQAQAHPGLAPNRFIGIQVQTFDAANQGELGQALKNVQQQLD
jgi:hypothetical protein